MKTLIKKEIRLLLPAWIAAMLLAIFSPWIFPASYEGEHPLNPIFRIIFFLGVLFLGISSFGMEFSSGTFAVSLSQPTDRRVIWKVKTTTLFLAFLAVWLAAIISFLCRFHILSTYISGTFQPFYWQDYKLASLETLTLSALVTFSGGLWTTLLLRQMTSAFWVTLLTPLAVMIGLETVLDIWITSDHTLNTVVVAVLAAYSVAGFFLARWLFFRAQDAQWTGGNISFAWRAGARSTTTPMEASVGRRGDALLLKEFRLHQVNLLIAGILAMFQLCCLAALKIYPHFSPDTKFALQSILIIWFLMPLLIGSSVVAEERRLGVLETQLCLTASRRMQWLAKIFVALSLSVLLGGFVPFVIAKLVLTDPDFQSTTFAAFLLYSFAMFVVSAYASSLVRSSLLAIGIAMAITAIIWAACAAIVTWNFGNFFLNDNDSNTITGLLLIILSLGLPVLIIVLSGLTFWNFKWLHEASKLWRRNTIWIFAVVLFVGIVANAIYFRAWEPVIPLKPVPGPARLNNAARLQFRASNNLFAVLPNGRLWSGAVNYEDVTNLWWQGTFMVPEKNASRYIPGSNWVNVAVDFSQAIGIQSDGTMWSIQRKWNPYRSRWQQSGPFSLAQIGSDTDWTKAVRDRNGFMLLKRDGSLWRWGTNTWDWENWKTTFPRKLELDRATVPVPLGSGNDWTNLFESQNRAYAQKNDGTLWREADSWETSPDSGLVPISAVNTNGPWLSIALWADQGTIAEVKTNGELWLYRTESSSTAKHSKPNLRKILLGGNAKWKKCGTEAWSGIWAIREDGTLWTWPAIWGVWNTFQSHPTQLGTRSDWLSLSDAGVAGISLAADGSVWSWNQASRHIWLARPRKPLYIGNVFVGSEQASQPNPGMNAP